MAQERFRQTGGGSFFGELIYERVVPQDHFLRRLSEVVDWGHWSRRLARYYQGGAAGRYSLSLTPSVVPEGAVVNASENTWEKRPSASRCVR